MGISVILVSGTDTGVGKTLATALMLSYLRSKGAAAIALKPFCSGGRADAELLWQLQGGDLTLEEINPFYFPEPVAPLVSARKHKTPVSLQLVMAHVKQMQRRLLDLSPRAPRHSGEFHTQKFLLIEGSGGLLVPLGENYSLVDLIHRLECQVVVVSRNRLGTINHTLLTFQALRHQARNRASGPSARRKGLPRCLLMDTGSADYSSRSNALILREMLQPVPLICLPFLGKNCDSPGAVKKNAKKFQKTLARLFV